MATNTRLPTADEMQPGEIVFQLERLVLPLGPEWDERTVPAPAAGRQQTEEELLRSFSTLRGFVDSVRGFVSYVDAQQRYQLVNRHYLEWFGKPESYFIGRHLQEVHRPATYADMLPHVRECLRGHKVQSESYLMGRDGKPYYFDVQHIPRRAADGMVQGFFVLVFDITVRRVAEVERQRLLAKVFHAEDEARRHIARELHDTTGQQLTALKLNLTCLKQLEPNSQAQAEKLIGESIALAEQAVQEIRTLTFLLHPPLLEELGLPGALRDYASGFSHRSGISVTVQAEQYDGHLSRGIELVLFRVVQESLANVLRHSGSASALIRLEHDDEQVRLEIQDCGHGLLPATRAPGVGIAGMRERLRVLGGTLEVESDAGGVTVLATVPVQQGS